MRQQVAATAEQNSPATIPTCSFYMRVVLKTCDARFRNPSSLSTSRNYHRQASIVSIQNVPRAWALACRDSASPGEHRSPIDPLVSERTGRVRPGLASGARATQRRSPPRTSGPPSALLPGAQGGAAGPAWAQVQGRPS
jgi:hypothetical protein